MRKLSRAAMVAWKKRRLQEQGGLCPLCTKPIDLTIAREGVIDHDHETGEIRGVLHRSCNSGEGKASNAIGSWIAKSMKQTDINDAVRRLLDYYNAPGCGYIYPTHKTQEERESASRDKRNLLAKQRRAKIKAAKALARSNE